ncbi:uncharacterized protein AAEQ78_017766 [Lycaon pictus]
MGPHLGRTNGQGAPKVLLFICRKMVIPLEKRAHGLERYGGHEGTSEDNISARQPGPPWGAVFVDVGAIEWAGEGRSDLAGLMVSLPESVPDTSFLSVVWEKGVMKSSRGHVLQEPKATTNRETNTGFRDAKKVAQDHTLRGGGQTAQARVLTENSVPSACDLPPVEAFREGRSPAFLRGVWKPRL